MINELLDPTPSAFGRATLVTPILVAGQDALHISRKSYRAVER
jgi:hypothetical protein